MDQAGSEQYSFPGLRVFGNDPTSAIIGWQWFNQPRDYRHLITATTQSLPLRLQFKSASSLQWRIPDKFLWAFAKQFRKATVSFVMSACLSVDVGQLDCPGYLRWVQYGGIFRKPTDQSFGYNRIEITR